MLQSTKQSLSDLIRPNFNCCLKVKRCGQDCDGRKSTPVVFSIWVSSECSCRSSTILSAIWLWCTPNTAVNKQERSSLHFDILRIFVSREIPYDATEKVARRQSNLPGYFGSGGKKPSLCSSKSYQAAFFDQMLSSGHLQRSLLVSSDHAFGFPSLLQLSSLFLPDRVKKN